MKYERDISNEMVQPFVHILNYMTSINISGLAKSLTDMDFYGFIGNIMGCHTILVNPLSLVLTNIKIWVL